MQRRMFLGALLSAGLRADAGIPVRHARPVRLFKSPDGAPNALEATPDGLWVGEQVTDRAYLLDWKTGKVLQRVDTESSNTSGMAYGGGYLWMGANGKALMRELRPGELTYGRIVQVDPKTGHTVKVHRSPDGGGVHGLVYADNSLFFTSFQWNTITRVHPETFEVISKFPLLHSRPHGLAYDPPAMWVGYSNDFVFVRQDLKDGHATEIVAIDKGGELDPHGFDMYQGTMYVTDAGIAPPGVLSHSPGAGYIFRLEFD